MGNPGEVRGETELKKQTKKKTESRRRLRRHTKIKKIMILAEKEQTHAHRRGGQEDKRLVSFLLSTTIP